MSSVHEKSGEQAGLALLTKGKGTKRQRSESPLEAREEEVAGGEVEVREATDQDQHMANCLMLLSQGQTENSDKKQEGSSGLKLEGPYKCKTCDKSFNSFQALGGHRAGHKKVELGESVFKFASAVETVEAARAGRSFHKCLICKAVLPSGQALGAHMRKHRGFRNPISSSLSHHDEESGRPKNMLQFDLNLPAAPEDELQYAFLSKDQILSFVAETNSFVACQSLIKYFM